MNIEKCQAVDSLATRYRWSGILLSIAALLIALATVAAFISGQRRAWLVLIPSLPVLPIMMLVRSRLSRQISDERKKGGQV